MQDVKKVAHLIVAASYITSLSSLADVILILYDHDP